MSNTPELVDWYHFGFVEMSTSEEATSAIEKFDGVDCEGRPLRVNEAKPMEPRPNSGFSR